MLQMDACILNSEGESGSCIFNRKRLAVESHDLLRNSVASNANKVFIEQPRRIVMIRPV
jgi:hypothetical protein